MLNSCTHLSHEQHLSTHENFFFFFSHIPSLPFSFSQPKRLPSSLVSFHDLSLSLFPLPNRSLKILPSNQWPPHPSRTNENWKWFALQLILGWEFLGPMKHKKKSILQSNKMAILVINGIRGFILSLILDILMRFLSLILILFVRWPSHPTSLS